MSNYGKSLFVEKLFIIEKLSRKAVCGLYEEAFTSYKAYHFPGTILLLEMNTCYPHFPYIDTTRHILDVNHMETMTHKHTRKSLYNEAFDFWNVFVDSQKLWQFQIDGVNRIVNILSRYSLYLIQWIKIYSDIEYLHYAIIKNVQWQAEWGVLILILILNIQQKQHWPNEYENRKFAKKKKITHRIK